MKLSDIFISRTFIAILYVSGENYSRGAVGAFGLEELVYQEDNSTNYVPYEYQ